MNKWTENEKDVFLTTVEQQQYDTFEEEVEMAWDAIYVNPDEVNDFPKRTLGACKNAIYRIIGERRKK